MKSQPVKSFHEKTHSSSFEESFELREFSAILEVEREQKESEKQRVRKVCSVLQLGLQAIIGAQIQARPASSAHINMSAIHACRARATAQVWQVPACGKVNRLRHAVDIGTLFNYEINIMPTKPLKGATIASLAACPTHLEQSALPLSASSSSPRTCSVSDRVRA